MRVRKRSDVYRAWMVRWINEAFSRDNWKGLPDEIHLAYREGGWVPGVLRDRSGHERGIYIPTQNGSVYAGPEDWIILDPQGNFDVCKARDFDDIFEKAGKE